MADQQPQATTSRSKNIAAGTALAVLIAMPCEGLRQRVYLDPVGIPTVCWGQVATGMDQSKTYSIDECKGLLNDKMTAAVAQVDKCVPGLPPEVLAAFGSAVYNMGPTIACNKQASTAARDLAAGHLVDACNQLPAWNKARVAGVLVALPGLTNRRALERAQCLKAPGLS